LYVGIAGEHVRAMCSTGVVAISGHEIMRTDVDRVNEVARAMAIPQDRELLLHRYTASAGTLDDFAQRMGRSVGGLKVTLHRLRNALLGCIEKQLAITEAES
jgi:DNA-directed RNA polymerase specialized sigma24 family protein